MDIILERREEAFEILFGEASLQDFLTACVLNHGLHFIDRDVTIPVCVSALTEVLFKGFLCLELIL